MHSSDRTLLARLGFSDPDRKNSRHDLACQYLAAGGTRERLLRAVFTSLDVWRPSKILYPELQSEGERMDELVEVFDALHEVPIGKGEGQYRTTIGFLDLVVPARLQSKFRGRERRNPNYTQVGDAGWGPWTEVPEDKSTRSVDLAIEVKIEKVSVGDLIRQMKLYREYARGGFRTWVAVTQYALPAIDVQQLRTSGIFHIQLGAGFEQFINDLPGTPGVNDPKHSPEI